MLNVSPISSGSFRSLSRAEYDRFVELGTFADRRLELIRGEVVEMSPQGPRHASTTWTVHSALAKALDGRAIVRCQLPIAISGDSELEPDVAVLPLGDYSDAHPTTAHLVVEVADSSLPADRGIKAELYAEAGIVEYWVINLVERVIEVHRNPETGRYRGITTCAADTVLRPVAFPDLAISAVELL